MKKTKLAVFAMVIACGTFAAVAATTTNSEATKKADADLFWFDAVTGQPLGQRSQSAQQSICGPEGTIDCAYGYESLDNEGNPEGAAVPTTKL